MLIDCSESIICDGLATKCSHGRLTVTVFLWDIRVGYYLWSPFTVRLAVAQSNDDE
jgi:hypothetical protein